MRVESSKPDFNQLRWGHQCRVKDIVVLIYTDNIFLALDDCNEILYLKTIFFISKMNVRNNIQFLDIFTGFNHAIFKNSVHKKKKKKKKNNQSWKFSLTSTANNPGTQNIFFLNRSDIFLLKSLSKINFNNVFSILLIKKKIHDC